jgi:hypothetical protein
VLEAQNLSPANGRFAKDVVNQHSVAKCVENFKVEESAQRNVKKAIHNNRITVSELQHDLNLQHGTLIIIQELELN